MGFGGVGLRTVLVELQKIKKCYISYTPVSDIGTHCVWVCLLTE